MNRPPVLPAYLDGTVATVACPYCGQEHRHGRRLGETACQPVDGSHTCACITGTPADGHYTAPCDPEGPGYTLVVLTRTTPATLARAAARMLGVGPLPASYTAVHQAVAAMTPAQHRAFRRTLPRTGARRAAK